MNENQCSGGADEDDGDDDCGGDGDDDGVNAEAMVITINDDLESFRFYQRLKCLFSGVILLDQYVGEESESWVIGQVISLINCKELIEWIEKG